MVIDDDVPAKVMAPLYVRVTPVVATVKLPYIDKPNVPAKVTFPDAGPEIVKLLQADATSTVSV